MEKVVMLGGIGLAMFGMVAGLLLGPDRKSTRLNSSHD